MKKQAGFTLVELMVVVSMVMLLMAWGIPAYSTWNTKHGIENQMVQLYSDLQFGRMTAYGTKAVSGVLWANNFKTYQIMSDTQNNGTIDANATPVPGTGIAAPKYAVTFACANGQPCLNNQPSVSFDGRGFLYANAPDITNPITFYVTPSYGTGIDCVAVSSTRVTLGKWNGTSCAPK